MTARDFFIRIPALCGAKNADRWSDVIAYMYDSELEGNPAFARNGDDEVDPDNRMEIAFAFQGEPGAKRQCLQLARILLYQHYAIAHGEKDKYGNRIDRAVREARVYEADYPAIASVLTVDQATTLGGWNI